MDINGLGSYTRLKKCEGRSVGFIVRQCLVEEVEFINKVCYEESLLMNVRGGRERDALYMCLYAHR